MEGGNACLQKLVKEEGQDNFRLEILETVEFRIPKGWKKQEKFWIAKFREEGHPLCNKNDGGGGPTEQTEETKTKLSKVLTGKRRSEEVKQKNSEIRLKYYETHDGPMKGKRHTKETRQKQSKTKKEYFETHDQWNKGMYGEETPFFGEHHTEATKQVLRDKQKEWHETHENSFKGEHHNKNSKEQMSLNSGQARPYPAFYNEITKEHISPGHNLRRMCREHGLIYRKMLNLKNGNIEQTGDGWRAIK